MKIVFFGTPGYVLPVVESLHREYNRGRERQFITVVTQPPKPVGRDKHVEHSPVDNWAYKHKLPIVTDINETPKADLGVLASYGQIIPREVINRFEHGIINIHPSALPKFRGASPIQATIIAGKENATVTVMKMDEKMDHGPVISTFKEKVKDDDTTGSLRDRLFDRSAQFIIDLIPSYLSGKIKLAEQDHDRATFTKLITKQDGFIPPIYIDNLLDGHIVNEEWKIRWIKDYALHPSPVAIHNFIRAMKPWPIAFTQITNPISQITKRLIIHNAHVEDNMLLLDEVQVEGKGIVSWKEFERGYPDFKFD